MPQETNKNETLSDADATARFGVGPSGEAKKWVVYGEELVLLDDRHGIVYRKRIAPSGPSRETEAKSSEATKKAVLGSTTPPPTAPTRPSVPVGETQRVYEKLRQQRGVSLHPDEPFLSPAQKSPSASGALERPGVGFPAPPAPPRREEGPESRAARNLPFTQRREDRWAYGARNLDWDRPTSSNRAVTPSVSGATKQAVNNLSPAPDSTENQTKINLPSDDKAREPKELEEPLELDVSDKGKIDPPKGKNQSPSVDAVVDSTINDLGFLPAPKDTVIVTEKSLQEQSKTEARYEITIDPNTNKAWINAVGSDDKIASFSVGTGDTTGTKYEKKYWSPVGVWSVKNKIPYGDVEGSYGPLWMGFDTKPWLDRPAATKAAGYGMHGPYRQASVLPDSSGFVNKGYVSHGCVRFTVKDMYEVGKYLDIGSTVTVLPYKGGRVIDPNLQLANRAWDSEGRRVPASTSNASAAVMK